MPQFDYIAVNKKGEKLKGTLDVPGEADVRVFLRSQQLRPVKISKTSAMNVDLGALLSGGSQKTTSVDVLVFSRQLSILIGSGVPLVQGLDIIGQQMASPGMRMVVNSIKDKLQGGTFLWEAMASHKKTFSDIYVNMVRAGEASGALDAILKRLIKYMDDAEKLKKIVKSAMIYPIAVVSVGTLVMIGMLVFVIPKFESLLKGNNQELPLPTQIVINASHFVQNNILFIIGGIVGTIFLVKTYVSTPEGRRVLDYNLLKAPLFGDLLNKVAVARFSRVMQTMLVSGINLLDALDICKSAIGNKIMEENIEKIKSEVEQGKTLSTIMAKVGFFPPMAVQMVAVGENTGNIDKMLEKVADWYEEEVESAVGNLTKLMEPIILVGLGGMVAGMLIAMYLPVFKMAGGA